MDLFGYADPEKEWDRARAAGLRPEIQTLEQYEAACKRGAAAALDYLRGNPTFSPDAAMIKEVHGRVFGEVYPWAGTFRNAEDEHFIAQARREAGLGERPEQIEGSIAALSKDCSKRFAEAFTKGEDGRPRVEDPKAVCATIARYHTLFEGIHPFREGNGRAGRVIMEAQMEHCFGQGIVRSFERGRYEKLVAGAVMEGNIEPFENFMVDLCAQADKVRAREVGQSIEKGQADLAATRTVQGKGSSDTPEKTPEELAPKRERSR